MALLDTTALIDLTRGPASADKRRLRAVLTPLVAAGQTLCTSRVNEAELRVGEFRVPAQAVAIHAVLASVVILELDATAARRYGQVQAQLQAAGRPAGGQADMLIAAVALANGQSLVTRNVRHFATVPGLTVVGY